jgi:Uma2 family endonuclease
MPTDVLVSPEEYLAREREAERKHEYRDGEIIPMAGATRQHVLIVTNVAAELRDQLYDRDDCLVFSTDLRVQAGEEQLFTYPDVAVACGEPHYRDDQFDTLLNPTLLVEVLSKSTRDYDRGGKFARYRTIATLCDYVLIDQERAHVEHFSKQDDGRWVLEETDDREATLALDSVGAELALAEVYHKVDLEA